MGSTTTSQAAQRLLFANAAFSAATGAIAVFASSFVAHEAAIRREIVMTIGGGLLVYAVLLTITARRGPTASDLMIGASADAGWVIVVIALLALGRHVIAADGRWILAATSLPVGVFAALQWRLAREHQTSTHQI